MQIETDFKEKIDFEDLDANIQEIIVDLIASIIKNKNSVIDSKNAQIEK